ncbi:hypothetical protein IFM89_033153 [Coptis chinensis]|uniref:Uncharacterized protein n=1 Tax=Coptis chinensis TaxID=261450 RepID=A0A835M2B5_9MAGN|nr:hypothetical protein IFM89_033153 [Coptis chinensis]
MRNFLWTGDPSRSRATTISWEKVCKPLNEGGLGIRRLRDINSSMLMKLAWRILIEVDDFATFMKLKYFSRDGDTCQYYKASSIWPGVREALLEVKSRSQWVIGNGAKADLIRDNWLSSTSLQSSLELTLPQLKGFNAKVNSILVNNNWSIPLILQNMLDVAGLSIDNVHRGASKQEDYMVWSPDTQGRFTCKSAFDSIRRKANPQLAGQRVSGTPIFT